MAEHYMTRIGYAWLLLQFTAHCLLDANLRGALRALYYAATGTGRETFVVDEDLVEAAFEHLRGQLCPDAACELLYVACLDRPDYGTICAEIEDLGANPIHVSVFVSPDLDAADIAATLVHELVHVRLDEHRHDYKFKRELRTTALVRWAWSDFQLPTPAVSFKALDRAIVTTIRWRALYDLVLAGQRAPLLTTL